MGQRLDRRYLLVYLACLGAACRSDPGMVIPAGAEPVTLDQVSQWVASTTPSDHQLHRFKWLFKDERASAGGQGSARVAPPDSLRFDVAGPFGSGAGSAVVVGDRAVWTEPPDAIAKMVPNYPLMWAMFGVARMPPDGVNLRGLSQGEVVAWQYAGASDTIAYVRRTGNPVHFIATVHQGGHLIGQSEAELAPDGRPLKARLTVPSAPAQLDLTFLSSTPTSFAPDIWLPARP
ncbi:MAG TPA: hypothetical protein VFH40_04365 [Gemmatimonadales bacterium]|nr:hypothetical protein [Gemmatimonadales bacterium]